MKHLIQCRACRIAALLVGSVGGLLLLIGPLVAFNDDWTYVTAPNPDFSWRDLLPGAAFWRPFDALWGGLLSLFPKAFPIANRMLNSLGHGLNICLVYQILKRLDARGGGRSALLGTVFFACSSAMLAALINADSMNQIYSCLFGLLAVWLALGERIVLAYSCVVVSILCKEGGASWLAVIPLINFWQMRDVKRLIREGLMGGVVLIGYFALRFVLYGGVVLGDGNYYSLGFNIKDFIVNLGIGAILPISGLDGLALVCRKIGFAVVSLFAAGVMWTVLGAWVWRGADRVLRLIVAALMIGALALPYCCFAGHHPAEMHFYPVVFGGAFLIGTLDLSVSKRALVVSFLGAMVVLFAFGWIDKLGELYCYSQRTRSLLEQLGELEIDYSRPVYFVVEESEAVRSYSSFTQTAMYGTDFGAACRKYNGWRDFERYVVFGEKVNILPQAQIVRINGGVVLK